jgi:hypothetical protein
MCGASERSVSRALADLEALGLIVREQRRAADGYRTSDRYWLQVGHVPIMPATTVMDADDNETERQVTERHVTNATTSRANLSDLTRQSGKAIEPPEEPLEESPEERAHEDSEIDFELDLPGGTRIPKPFPDLFPITQGMIAWAKANAPSVNVGRVTNDFMAYWRVGEGLGKRKKNWELCWRNWLKREHERNVDRGWKPPDEDKPLWEGGRRVR